MFFYPGVRQESIEGGDPPPQKKNLNEISIFFLTFFSQKGAFSGPSKLQKIVILGPLILQKYLSSFQGPWNAKKGLFKAPYTAKNHQF